MNETLVAHAVILLPLLLQLAGLTFAALRDPYIEKRDKKLLLLIAGVLLSLIALDTLEAEAERIRLPDSVRVAMSAYGYCMRPVVPVLFIRIVSEKKKQPLLWGLIGLNAALYLTAFFTPLTFTYQNGHFFRGPLYLACTVLSFGLLAFHVIQVLKKYRDSPRPEALLPIFCVALNLAGAIVDMNLPKNPYVSFLTVVMVSCSLFYYIWLHLQFARAHEQALAAEGRIRIMLSQISPHFLFNTLSTIQALCRTDPDRAFDTLEKFGVYLRQNIDSLGRADPVPIEKELEHTRVYAEIERLRFPNIRVEYEIADSAFSLPALTVQPLVENAIRHGVRIRDKGLVNVRTEKKNNAHVITITDNGRGFDVKSIETADETHIGIRNVRERVEKLAGGKLTIESDPERGTTVTITIPAGKENEA